MIRQVVYVPLDNIESADERTKAIEASCNWDWLAEYRLIDTSPFVAQPSGGTAATQQPGATSGLYLFFEKD